jgi:thiamine-phosphate pyrophosphorylase
MKKFIDSFHYLTQDLEERSHIEQAQIACSQGAKWIQYRCFSKSDEEMLEEIHQIASICDDWGTTLIVTDHIHLVHQADIQGVHIEDMDADLSLVRSKIGDDKTLGASATNLEQIVRHIQNGADYIGCGPFGHTDTKPNTAKHWKIEGYQEIVSELKKQNLTHIPLIAAGGISIADVEDLLKTGIYGVAISAAVNKAENPAQSYKELYRLLH